MSAETVQPEGTDTEAAQTALPAEDLQPSQDLQDSTEATETADALNAAEEQSLPSAGARLRSAREANGMSAADVSRALKLSVHQIEALEADDWSRLPCNTIIRGFVRNYARLVGLESAELMAALDSARLPTAPELAMPQGTNVSVPQEGAVERRDYVRVLLGAGVVALAAGIYFFLPDDALNTAISAVQSMTQRSETPAEAPAGPVASEEPAPAAETSVPPAETSTAPATPAATAVTASSAAPATPSATAAPVAPEPAPSAASKAGGALKLSFEQPSWVEIRDRDGEILFSQLSPGGAQREVEGRPPFSLVIGNATYVTVLYKGKPVDLSKRSKDDVARVTVE